MRDANERTTKLQQNSFIRTFRFSLKHHQLLNYKSVKTGKGY